MIKGILMVLSAYLIGNLDFAYIVVKAVKNEDVRDYGSGNAGTTNVLRILGIKYAAPVFILDALKGTLVILLAQMFGFSEIVIALSGVAVICGHNWPIFLGYRGGKGSATSIGLILVYDWRIGIIAILVAAGVIFFSKMISLGSIVGMTTLPICAIIFRCAGAEWVSLAEIGLFVFLCASSIFRHRTNIKRIINGTESKVGQRIKVDDHTKK